MSYRSAEEIYSSILDDFKTNTGKEFRSGTVMSYFTSAMARAMEIGHTVIEAAKNPHIYTNLEGDNLDKMGVFVGVPREENETDKNYLYRIMNWKYLKAGANLTAVNDSLLNLTYASDAKYYPGIYGAGTGVVYVIPTEYTEETIQKALEEAKERIYDVISPELYTQYVIPTPVPVKVVAKLVTEDGDINYLKDLIAEKVKTYVNAIAPNDYLSVGTINKEIIQIDNVDYFSVNGIYVNGTLTTDLKILQILETKLLFEEINWED